MNSFALLLHHHPLVFAHMVLALGALLLGGWMLWGRKGNAVHRRLGWAWVVLMGGAALTSAFLRDSQMPNIAGFTPIHLLTVVVLWTLPRGIWFARQGRVAAHRATMRALYGGGCIAAGLFTLLPGRFLGAWLWAHLPGLA